MKKVWFIIKMFVFGFIGSCFGWSFIDGLIKGITNLHSVATAATAWSGVGIFLLGVFRVGIFIAGCFIVGDFAHILGVWGQEK